MRITILGAEGMLGHDILRACRESLHVACPLGSAQCDVTDLKSLANAVPACDWVINCAAYTRVDAAESDAQKAFALNEDGARNVAVMCASRGLRLVHLGTDYVFDGSKGEPCLEDDPVNPLNIYGASKLGGEQAVQDAGGRFLIVRTQALFGRHGPSFVRTMANRFIAADRNLRVVDDETTAPTYTRHLAQAIMRLLACGQDGIVHVSAAGFCTWYQFAREIASLVRPKHPITAVSSKDYKAHAKRPAYSVMDTSRFQEWTGSAMPTWQEGLQEFVREMGWQTAMRRRCGE